MENESALLERLRQHDPKVFKAVFEDYSRDMFDQAILLLGNNVKVNAIVTRVWYNELSNSFQNAIPPLRNYFLDQISIECDIVRIVGLRRTA